ALSGEPRGLSVRPTRPTATPLAPPKEAPKDAEPAQAAPQAASEPPAAPSGSPPAGVGSGAAPKDATRSLRPLSPSREAPKEKKPPAPASARSTPKDPEPPAAPVQAAPEYKTDSYSTAREPLDLNGEGAPVSPSEPAFGDENSLSTQERISP